MNPTLEAFTTFGLCCYCMGWCLNGYRAHEYGRIDLCQFVRSFFMSPFFTFLAFIGGIIMWAIGVALILNIKKVIVAIAFIVGVGALMGLVSYFVVVPGVKKAVGVAKPFSDKICVIMYDKHKLKSTKGSGV